MIKAIILDVDGVIVGKKKDFNFPQPHPRVIARLRATKQSGTPIILCTAKPSYAAEKIINDARLNNVHITMAGAVIIDPIDNVVLRKYTLPSGRIQSLIDMYLGSGVYIEAYTSEGYFVQADQVSEFTDQRIQVLQTKPTVVQSLTEAVADKEIVKVMPVAADETDRVRITQLFKPYQKDLTLSWTLHPFTLPHQYGNVTAQGISKRQAVSIVADSLEVQAADILGVGDGMADWQFIELCGYGAAMGNADEELKQLVAAKGDHGYTGPSVDDHGILDIFDHFKL